MVKKQNRIEDIKRFLDPERRPSFYKNGDFISAEDYAFIQSELTIIQRRQLVPIKCEGEDIHFSLESKCPDCGRIEIIEISPSKVYKSHGCAEWGGRCKDCLSALTERVEAQLKKEQERQRELYEKQKEEFSKYISPEYSFNKGMKPYEKVRALERYLLYCEKDYETFAEKIKNLDYGDFLRTPYWDAVRCKIRYKYKYRCALCNNSQNLRVHHKTYKHHGYEWFYLEDLILLCDDCHEKFHDIESEG